MDPDKILEAYVGLTRISCIKISAPWAKGAQNGSKKGVCFFVMDTVYSQFFVTGQTGIKFGQRTSFDVLYWTLTEEFWKFSLKGWFCPKTTIFCIALMAVSMANRSGITFFNLAKPSIY